MKLLNTFPQIKPHLVVEILAAEKVTILLAEEDSFVFENDTLLTELVPLLNGRHSVREIILLLNERQPFTEVVGRINLLHQRKLLNFYQASAPGPEAVFWSAHGINPRENANRKAALRVFGNVDVDSLQFAWVDGDPTPDDSTSQFTLVVTDDYLHDALDLFNRETDSPWLLVKPVGKKIWLGPLIIREKSACWECLAQRLRLQRKVHRFICKNRGYNLEVPYGYLEVSVQMGLNMAAIQVERWFAAPEDHPLLNRVITLDTVTFEQEIHVLSQRPQCKVCGNPTPKDPQPIRLQKRKKAPHHDGGHRTRLPDEMYDELKVHISPITGVVRELELRGGSKILNIYDANLSYPSTGSNWHGFSLSSKMGVSGKGVSREQAQASALGEALERYSSFYDGTEKVVDARFSDLGDQAILPASLMNFSARQYQERQTSNLSNSYRRETFIPIPIDLEKPLPWVPVWSLHRECWRYVPAAYCFLQFPQKPDQAYYPGDTNGNAAGTSLEDAILQGFFELVERDSVALWWYNRLPKSGISLEGINDAYIASLKNYYAARGREFWVLDITSDLVIPSFAAVSRRVDGGAEQIISGFGAHLDPKIAILRAITEMNQSMPISDQNIRKTRSSNFPNGRNILFNASINKHKYLIPDASQTEKRVGDYTIAAENDDLMLDIHRCLEISKANNLEMLIHDLTRPDIGLPVVKVIVPGLRHFWRRLGVGRLYDVPVKQRWLEKPTLESNMNPLDLN